jgi:hypothetical protein
MVVVGDCEEDRTGLTIGKECSGDEKLEDARGLYQWE